MTALRKVGIPAACWLWACFNCCGSKLCLRDAIPVTEQTREALGELLDAFEQGSPFLTQGRVFTWIEDDVERTAFLPRGSRLRGELSTARSLWETMDGSTMSFDRPELRGIESDDQEASGSAFEEPLRLWRLDWPSANVSGEVFRILAEEGLRIRVNVSQGSAHSSEGVQALVDCRISESSASAANDDPEVNDLCASGAGPRAHVLLEGWRAAVSAADDIPEAMRPVSAGVLDYLGFESVFLQSDLVRTGSVSEGQCTPPLDFYRSYNFSVFPTIAANFDNLSSVLGNLSSEQVIPCKDWQSTSPTELRNYLEHTGDEEGVVFRNATARMPNCSDDGRVWLSPSCRGTPERCIPFVTQSSYYIPEVMQQSVFWQQPIAVMDLTPDAWVRVGSNMSVLLQWWVPDKAFVGMQAITMPSPDKEERDDGLYRTGQYGDLHKYVWRGLAGVAPEAHHLVQSFSLNVRAMNGFMAEMHDQRDASDVACDWVRRSSQKWSKWLPGPCNPGTELLQNGSCRECEAGFVSNQSTCVPCPAGTMNPTRAGTVCLQCATGWSSAEGSSACYLEEESANQAWEFLTIAASAALVVSLLTLAVCAARMHVRTAKLDRPDIGEMPIGSWVLKWVGPHVHERLTAPQVVSRSRSSFGSPMGASWRLRGNAPGFWIVNASPFAVRFILADSDVDLDAESFTKAFCTNVSEFQIQLFSNAKKPRREWERLGEKQVVKFITKETDWQYTPTAQDNSGINPVMYESSVVRMSLPDPGDGRCLGHIKMTRGPGGLLLLMWSPPHTLRGVPFPEFERFLNEVIDFPETWECPDVDGGGRAVVVHKRPGSSKRNMYDACQHLVLKKVACLDASYAELCTDYGPPKLFISHVWRETAYNTRSAVAKLKEALITRPWDTRLTRKWGSKAQSFSHDSLDAQFDYRVWFCTVCNNQSRIKEELGQDVQYSPFAQVLSLPSCQRVALISPFLALERKWCNYEFCAAKHANKTVLMVTSEGIVQAGQVAPKTLDKLSRKIVAFNCERSTCTSPEDEALINEAIQRMGGYSALNTELTQIFHQAIDEAHAWAKKALDRIQCPDDSDSCAESPLHEGVGHRQKTSRASSVGRLPLSHQQPNTSAESLPPPQDGKNHVAFQVDAESEDSSPELQTVSPRDHMSGESRKSRIGALHSCVQS